MLKNSLCKWSKNSDDSDHLQNNYNTRPSSLQEIVILDLPLCKGPTNPDHLQNDKMQNIRESKLWTTPQHERVRLTTGPDISSATPTLSPNPPTIATTCSCSSLCSSKVFEMLSIYQKKWPLPCFTCKTANDRHNVVLLFIIVPVIRNM